MKEDGGKEVMSGLAELGFSPHSSSIVKKVVTDCDFEREESGEVCEKEVEERGMKNGSGLTSLHEGRKCTAAEAALDNGYDGDWKEMGEDLPNGDFEKEGEKEIKISLEGLNLHEAKKCTETVEIRTEDNGNEKEETEQGQDCNFEKNGGDKRDKICEKKEGKIEMKNSFEISFHETREYAAKLELYAENNGDLKEKREEGPDCTFEKIDGEKRYEICEKEEGEKEIENGKERDCTEPSELNTENWESKEKIEEGPDSNFEKQMGEKDVENEMERKYDEKVELHIEDKERSKEKVEEGPDCNFEKEGDEKSNEILENLMRREFTPKVELNTEENGDVNGKIEQGPDCDFEKLDAELKEEIHDKKKGEGKNDEFEKKEGVKVKYVVSYPQRIGRSDCPHYLKTGFCSYGYKCCFNHPPNIADQKKENCEFEKKEGAKVKYALPYPQRKGRPDCPSYLKTGFCSYGSKCLYNHPNQISDQFSSGSSWDYDDTYETEKINNSTQYVGLPIRPGQIDCPYYMKHGSCKYSTDCRYNHPNHFITKQNPLNYEEYQNNQYIENNDPLNYEEPNHFVTKQNPLHYEEYQNNRHIENNDPLNYEEPNHFVNKQSPLNYEEYQNNGYLENNDPLNYEEPNHFITKQNQHEGYQNNENFEENNDPYIYDDSSLNESDRSNVLLPINIKNMVLPKYEGDLPPNVKAMLLPPQRLHDTKQVPVSNSSYETYEEYFMDSSTSMSKSISSEKSKANLSEKSKPQSSEKSKSNPSEKSKSNSSYQMEVPFEFPERPGQEECAFYMKSGDCKFKYSCKFHHPRDRLSKKDYVGRNSSRNGSNKARLYDAIETQELLMSVHQKGLREHQFPSEAYGQENLQNGKIKQKKREKYPERPGKPLCEYYMRHGDCKFKFTCKFHHPKDPYQQDLAFPTSDSEYRGCSGQLETGWN